MTPIAHVVLVAATWTQLLFGFRLIAAALPWLWPMAHAGWRLARCNEPGRVECRAYFSGEVAALHVRLRDAMTTPWSAPLLFIGAALIGAALVSDAVGDLAAAVTSRPDAWSQVKVWGDCLAAAGGVTGMSFVRATFAERRTASFGVSLGLFLTGIGIAVATL